jgi:hypothetical protein
MLPLLIHVVIVLVVLVVLGLIYWLVMMLPIPDPFKKIVQFIFIIIAVLYCLSLLLPLAGMGWGGGGIASCR